MRKASRSRSAWLRTDRSLRAQAALAEALGHNDVLHDLVLDDNHLGSEGVQLVADALRRNTRLTSLSLQSNCVTAEGAMLLSQALRANSSLQVRPWRAAPPSHTLTGTGDRVVT